MKKKHLIARAPRLHEGNRDGVAEEHLDGGGGDGCEVERAELALLYI